MNRTRSHKRRERSDCWTDYRREVSIVGYSLEVRLRMRRERRRRRWLRALRLLVAFALVALLRWLVRAPFCHVP